MKFILAHGERRFSTKKACGEATLCRSRSTAPYTHSPPVFRNHCTTLVPPDFHAMDGRDFRLRRMPYLIRNPAQKVSLPGNALQVCSGMGEKRTFLVQASVIEDESTSDASVDHFFEPLERGTKAGILLKASLDDLSRVDDGGVITPSEAVADDRERRGRVTSAEVHGNLPR